MGPVRFVQVSQRIPATLVIERPPVEVPFFDPVADGIVNSFDLELLAAALGTGSPAADLNDDGIVNLLDFVILGTLFD